MKRNDSFYYAASEGLFGSDGLPSDHNWKGELQPMQLPTINDHLQVTANLRSASIDKICDMLIHARFIQPHEKAEYARQISEMFVKRHERVADLLCDGRLMPVARREEIFESLLKMSKDAPLPEEIATYLVNERRLNYAQWQAVTEKLKDIPHRPFVRIQAKHPETGKPDTELGFVDVLMRTKSAQRAEKKLSTDTVLGDPNKIRDYTAFKMIPSTGPGTAATRQAAHEIDMTSRKCGFVGELDKYLYLASKTHNLVSHDGQSQLIEVQIMPKVMADIEPVTHHLMEIEDHCQEILNKSTDTDTLVRTSRSLDETRALRTAANGKALLDGGLIRYLTDTQKDQFYTTMRYAADEANKLTFNTGRLIERLGGRFPAQVEGILGIVERGVVTRLTQTTAQQWGVQDQIFD